uniref:MAM and LDL-receptor class A domain-containing protein 1-like n=1 Tax=Ciona intestinalis TaxID=7719 RepID=UPI000EF503E3|nr:MAM and LDL-receptor class A domain-containing protein 1-like [Ciona intestinalis]|eukprot:XP_026691416.1 MAM and LDL-receptor class A domain-containing protein 1-like [Ciona intestinalis]
METFIVLLLLSLARLSDSTNSLFSCDFEQNNCAFSNDVSVELGWGIGDGDHLTSGTGPDGDHTTGTGKYWYMDSSRAGNGDLGRTATPHLFESGYACATLQFYYHMFGDDIGTLNVYVITDPPPYYYDNPVWSVTGDQGNQWLLGEVNISFPLDYMIAFEGTAKRSPFDNEGDIAIDDVSVFTGGCDYEICSLGVDWCKNGGYCIPFPNNTHVCDCVQGWEGVQCELDVDECASNPCSNGGNCTHGFNSYECFCGIGYHGTTCEFVDQCINGGLNRCENGGTCVPVENSKYCICAAGYTGVYCEIEIDECLVTPCLNGGTCTDLVNGYACNCTDDWKGYGCEFASGGCDFDLTSCDYSTDIHADFKWELTSGQTPNFLTGPNADHTTGDTGNYWFANAFSSSNGDRGILYSSTLPTSAISTCTNISFWYWMVGGASGTLNVHITDSEEVNANSIPAWSRSGKQGSDWLEGNIEISATTPYKIAFEVVKPAAIQYDDIAIDDVIISVGHCEFSNCFSQPCHNGGTCIEDDTHDYLCICTDQWTGTNCENDADQCLSNPCQHGGVCMDGYQSYTCNCDVGYVGLSCEYLKGSCDFEDMSDPICSYTHDVTGDFNWIHWSGETPSALTGPNGDHTNNGEGFYIYAEATGQVAGDTGRVMTPFVPGSGNACVTLSFWYSMYGGSIGELAVHVEFNNQVLPSPVWNELGSIGGGRPQWKYAELNISTPHDFRVVFESIMESKSLIDEDNRGDIAIDDVVVQINDFCDYEACFIAPCQHGGTCVAEGSQYSCLCPTDFSGPACEIYGQCETNPCQNGGVCEIGSNGDFECICLSGWVGRTCSEVDHCAPNPCENGGTCALGPITFTCHCQVGYTGDTCRDNPDNCVGNPCKNDGICTDGLGEFTCQCVEPFYGDVCDKAPGSCDFENNILCGWTVDGMSDYNWILEEGAGPNYPLSGPQKDHTYQQIGKGFYLFTPLYRSNPVEGSRYRIRSPTYNVATYGTLYQFDFFYHMSGSGIGTLNVFLDQQGSVSNLLTVTGEQGNSWLKFSHSFQSTVDWSIVIEHRTIETVFYMGDIAVDDLKVSLIEPPATTTVASTTETLATTTMTTTTLDSTTTQQATTTTMPTTNNPPEISTTTIKTTTTTATNYPPVTTTTKTRTTTKEATSLPMQETTTTADDNSQNQGGVSGGTIAGAVIGSLVAVAMLAGLVVWLFRNQKQNSSSKLGEEFDNESSHFAIPESTSVVNPLYQL